MMNWLLAGTDIIDLTSLRRPCVHLVKVQRLEGPVLCVANGMKNRVQTPVGGRQSLIRTGACAKIRAVEKSDARILPSQLYHDSPTNATV
jgi:hypothetical protein